VVPRFATFSINGSYKWPHTEVVGYKIGLKKIGLSLCILNTCNIVILRLLVKRSPEQLSSLPLEPCRSMHADQARRGILSHSRVHSGRFCIYKSEKTLVHFMPGNPFQWSEDWVCESALLFFYQFGAKDWGRVSGREIRCLVIQSNQDKVSRQDLDFFRAHAGSLFTVNTYSSHGLILAFVRFT